MRIAFSWSRQGYLPIRSIFLITLIMVVLSAGMVGCNGGGGGGGQYDLTISSTNGGSVTDPGEAGPYTYGDGTVVDLVATPDAGYRFVNWTGDVGTVDNVNAATTTITMNGNYAITANFEQIPPGQFALTVSSTSGGSVTVPGEATFTYGEGTVVDLVATPGAGYRFVNWTGDVGTVANVNSATTTITMNGDYSIIANFVAVYDLTISSTTGGLVITPGEAGPYAYDDGTVVDLVATPDAGYRFVNWTGDVGTVDNVNAITTTITMSGDCFITANFAPFAGGSGTEGDPYQIEDWYDLDNVRNYMDSYFVLVNNIDFSTSGYAELASPTANSGEGWQPIGTADDRFPGAFDGQGYEIRDLFIDRPYEDRVGLFCAVLAAGVIENINVLDADVTGSDGVGILVGATAGAVSDCSSSGSVSGDFYVGGLVGYNNPGGNVSGSNSFSSVDGYQDVGGLMGYNNYGDVSNSHSDGGVLCSYEAGGGLLGYNYYGTVDGSYSTGDIVGWIYTAGLVGYNNYGNVSNCYADGDVSSGAHDIGGLVARNYYGTVDNSHATGSVTGASSSSDVGGLVGENWYATVSNSYATGSVIDGGLYVGGLVGSNWHGTVTNCHAVGSVHGSDDAVGGLVGENTGTITNSYATGVVTGDAWFVGGLVGSNWGVEAADGDISNCYATGNVDGYWWGVGGLLGVHQHGTLQNSYATGSVHGHIRVGGLVGENHAVVTVCYSIGSVTGDLELGGLVGYNYGTVANAFWDTQTSGQGTSAGGTPATTGQMKDIVTFTGAGWSIIDVDYSYERNTDYIWNIVHTVTYPFLSWQPV